MSEKKPAKMYGAVKDMVFCPFFVDFRTNPNAIFCQTCERGVTYEAKHFARRENMAEWAHEVCYRNDYAKKCSHAAAMNRYYANREG